MAEKNISEFIFDDLENRLKEEKIFTSITKDLMGHLRSKKPGKKEIERILREEKREDT